MTFDRDLLIKDSQPTKDTAEITGRIVKYFVTFTLIINIKYVDNENEGTIIDFKLNDFVVSIKGNRLNRK
jgi:hypothetical protein